jgi:hypothetical protein
VPIPIYLPQSGFAALDEIDRVPWGMLEHAYGRGIVSESLHENIPGALRELRQAEPGPGLKALFSNIYHQRTVYEATAYAVPFVAAVAAEPAFPRRLELVNLLAAIALSSTFSTEDGTMAGALGEGTAELIREALVKSEPVMRAAAALDAAIPPVVDSLLELAAADPVTDELVQRTRSALIEVEKEIVARAERAAEPQLMPTEGVRYRHAKFGDATLLRRLDGGRLSLRFDDGTERVIVERFVTRVDPG